MFSFGLIGWFLLVQHCFTEGPQIKGISTENLFKSRLEFVFAEGDEPWSQWCLADEVFLCSTEISMLNQIRNIFKMHFEIMCLCVYAICVYQLVNIHRVMLHYIFYTIRKTQIISTVNSGENHIVTVLLHWYIQCAYNYNEALDYS